SDNHLSLSIDPYAALVYQASHHLHLHSFPTRRSSDLPATGHRLCNRAAGTENNRYGYKSWRPRTAMPTRSWQADTTAPTRARTADRKSTRLNSSHVSISYAVFCLKKKTQNRVQRYNIR